MLWWWWGVGGGCCVLVILLVCYDFVFDIHFLKVFGAQRVRHIS